MPYNSPQSQSPYPKSEAQNSINKQDPSIFFGSFSIRSPMVYVGILYGIRKLLGMIKFDGSILYDVLIVGYTHSLLGLGLFFAGFYITSKLKNEFINKIISHFDHISYEIYLVHYMLIGGPLSVLFTNNHIVNCFIVLICTYILALILNKVSNIVNNKLDSKVIG